MEIVDWMPLFESRTIDNYKDAVDLFNRYDNRGVVARMDLVEVAPGLTLFSAPDFGKVPGRILKQDIGWYLSITTSCFNNYLGVGQNTLTFYSPTAGGGSVSQIKVRFHNKYDKTVWTPWKKYSGKLTPAQFTCSDPDLSVIHVGPGDGHWLTAILIPKTVDTTNLNGRF